VPDITLRHGHDELVRDSHRHLLSPLRRPRECHKYTPCEIRCQYACDEWAFATKRDPRRLGDGSGLRLDRLAAGSKIRGLVRGGERRCLAKSLDSDPSHEAGERGEATLLIMPPPAPRYPSAGRRSKQPHKDGSVRTGS